MTRFCEHLRTASYLAILVVYLVSLLLWPTITGWVTWTLLVALMALLVYICKKAREATEKSDE